MVDIVYIYGGYSYLCTIKGDPTAKWVDGTSLSLDGHKYFHWHGKIPNQLKPIMHRCLLEW